jgi:EpsI family protein
MEEIKDTHITEHEEVNEVHESTNGYSPEQESQPEPTPKPEPQPINIRRFTVPMLLVTLPMIALVVALQIIKPASGLAIKDTLHLVPTEFTQWRMEQEYEMSESARKELNPDESLSRIYIGDQGDYVDFTVIAGSHTGAFHNPQVCFRVARWEFAEVKQHELKVPGIEKVMPVTIVNLHNLDSSSKSVGMYFYRTPFGISTDTTRARLWLFLARVVGIKQRSYFVRFIRPSTGDEAADEKRLIEFATDLLSRMKQTNPEVVS